MECPSNIKKRLGIKVSRSEKIVFPLNRSNRDYSRKVNIDVDCSVLPSRPGASSLPIATTLRSQSLGVPREHRGLPDVVEAEVEHADALLQREKVAMLNHKDNVKLLNALRS